MILKFKYLHHVKQWSCQKNLCCYFVKFINHFLLLINSFFRWKSKTFWIFFCDSYIRLMDRWMFVVSISDTDARYIHRYCWINMRLSHYSLLLRLTLHLCSNKFFGFELITGVPHPSLCAHDDKIKRTFLYLIIVCSIHDDSRHTTSRHNVLEDGVSLSHCL